MKEKLIALFRKSKFYLLPVFSAGVILFLFFKIDAPQIEQIAERRHELSGIQERYAKILAKSRFLENLNEDKLRSDYEKVTAVLPEGKDAPSILRLVETAASSSGVTIESLNFVPGKIATESGNLPPPPGGKQQEIPVTLTVSGTIDQIAACLKTIFNSGRLMTLKNLMISFPEGKPVKANLTLGAYYFFAVESPQKIDEPLKELGSKENEVLVQVLQRELILPPPILSPSGKTDLFK